MATILGKMRDDMTEADWALEQQLRYKTWYDGAGIILKNQDGDILILKDSKSGKWSFPKGSPEAVDAGQPFATAIREVLEETGLQWGVNYEVSSMTPIRGAYNRYYFEAFAKDETPICLDNENSEFCWASQRKLSDLWSNLNSGIKDYMKLVQKPKAPQGYKTKFWSYKNKPNF